MFGIGWQHEQTAKERCCVSMVCRHVVYTSDTSFSPESVWPETKWQELKGRFILAASSWHAVGETVGEESHVLSKTEMPSHSYIQTKEMPNKGIANVVRQFAEGGYAGDTYGAQTT